MSLTSRVSCPECGRRDDGRRGWKAYLGGGVFGDPEGTFVFCPECDEREFGTSATATTS